MITLAVAGFDTNEIEVTLEENELTVSGRRKEDADRDYLHRGIATRQFQRTFVLADGMEVKGADLKDGLLSIELTASGIKLSNGKQAAPTFEYAAVNV